MVESVTDEFQTVFKMGTSDVNLTEQYSIHISPLTFTNGSNCLTSSSFSIMLTKYHYKELRFVLYCLQCSTTKFGKKFSICGFL